MQVISGYFSDRLYDEQADLNTAEAIGEMRCVFDPQGSQNILIIDNYDIREAGRQAIWKKSATERNLLLLFIGSCQPGSKLSKLYHRLKSEIVERLDDIEVGLDDRTGYFLRKATEVRQSIQFRVLLEPYDAESYSKTQSYDRLMVKAQKEIMEGQPMEEIERMYRDGLTSLISAWLMREKRLQVEIDRLLGEYPDLRLYLYLHNTQWPVMSPFLERSDTTTFLNIRETSDSLVLDEFIDTVRRGAVLPLNHARYWCIRECVRIFCARMGKCLSQDIGSFPLYPEVVAHLDWETALANYDCFVERRGCGSLESFIKSVFAFLREAKVVLTLREKYPQWEDSCQRVIRNNLIKIMLLPDTQRNELCPCGSGKKFKKCCLDKRGALKRPVEVCIR